MDRVEELDRRLCVIGLGAVRWRLALGEAFEQLGRVGGALSDNSMASLRRPLSRRDDAGACARNIVRYWTPEAGEDRPFDAVYRRDRYRCASPTCARREVGAHHIVFWAHGGSDAADSLVSLCGRCHVEGVHAGHIRVVGRAPGELRWELGRVVTVVGRTTHHPG